MKNLFRSMLVAAVAAAAIAGCSKDPETDAPDRQGFTLNLVADSEVAGLTRTEYDAAISNIKWSAGDEAVFFTNGTDQKCAAVIDANNKATFSLSGLVLESTNIQGYYPSSAYWQDGGNKVVEKKVAAYALTLPAEQQATSTSFDPLADILVARNMDNTAITEATKELSVQFGRPVAVSRFSFTVTNAALTGSTDKIEAVELKVASGDKFLAGNFYFNPETGYYVTSDGTTPVTDHTANAFAANASNKVVVKLTDMPAANAAFDAWFVTAPVTIKTGDELVFTLTTSEGKIITKTATAPNDLVFTTSKLNKMTVKLDDQITILQMEKATLTSSEIANSSGETGYGKEKTVTNEFGIWKTNGYKLAKTSNFFQIKKKDGDFSIDIPELAGIIRAVKMNVSSASVTQPGGNSTTLGFRENASAGFLSTGTGSSVVMLVNPSDCQSRSGSICATDGAVRVYDITVYYQPSTDPYFMADDISVTAAGQDREGSYTLNNTVETAVAATCDGTIVTSVAAESGLILYTVSGNYGTASRDGWIELSLTNNAAVTKRIAVTQAGSTFTVPESVSIANDKTSATFIVNSSDFGWTITPPTGITVSPVTGIAGETEVTVSSDAVNTGTETLLLGSLSILRTGDAAANATTIVVDKLAAGQGVEKTVTISFAGGTGKNISPLSFSETPINAVFEKGTHTTLPRWDTECVRFYGTSGKQNTLTVSGATITKIAFLMNGTYKMSGITASAGTLDNANLEWTGTSSNIVFTAGTSQTRFEGVTVTYTE